MATKTKKTPTSLTDRLDNMIEKISDLASEVSDGELSPNEVYDQLDKICSDLENMRDFL
jgi:predicted transcriptional regulator